MSEYWKSTPKYWCKHCGIFVRDTKLERANHEATGKHQGALKRFLRDLHRGHEKEERDKERAKREVERLNGVVSGSSTSSTALQPGNQKATAAGSSSASTADRQRQAEQLAQLGISLPSEVSSEIAMPGQWTVTSTRVIQDNTKEDPDSDDSKGDVATRAIGIRKREETEEQREEEEAIRGLFKKQKKWGRDSKAMPAQDDEDLDALLHTSLVPLPKTETEGGGGVRKEEDEADVDIHAKQEDDADEKPKIKREPDEDAASVSDNNKLDAALVKHEEDAPAGGVVFKKRKAKNIRQK
jgi:hypothetical protein